MCVCVCVCVCIVKRFQRAVSSTIYKNFFLSDPNSGCIFIKYPWDEVSIKIIYYFVKMWNKDNIKMDRKN
jgi:hypothetical protein